MVKFFKEVVCGDGHGGGCGAPRGIYEVSEERFDALDGPVRNVWHEHTDEEGPTVDGPMWVVLKESLCRDCREG